MKTRLLFILLLARAISYGQATEMLVDTSKSWSNLKQSASGSPPPHSQLTSFIKFSGDTLIGLYHFNKVLESTDPQQANYTIIGFIREDSTNKVFYRRLQDSTAKLLYNFRAAVGENIEVTGVIPFTLTLTVEAIDSIFIHNKYLKRMTLSGYGCWNEQWIEGIGSLCGVLKCGAHCLTGVDYQLLCYYENDSLKYQNPNYGFCYYNNVGINVFGTNNIKVNISPNPVISTSLLTIESNHRKDCILEIYSITGISIKTFVIRNNQLLINKNDFVSGLYMYRIIYPDLEIINGKFIIE